MEGFYIYTINIDENSNHNSPPYKSMTILNSGSGVSTCKVTGLNKHTLYEVFIVPFYKQVEGKPSNSIVSRTLEDGKIEK